MANPAEVITATRGGRTFRDNRRGIAHIDYTIERLAKRHPGKTLRIIQPPYNDAVAASAGTHDFGAVYDVEVVGLDWWEAQGFFRAAGWAAWYRHPPTFSPEHIHMISLGYPGRVGIYVPGQVDDYHRHALGLKGQHDSGLDHSWFPPVIAATVFDYPAWERDQEDNMPFTDWPKADRDALVKAVSDAVLDGLSGARLDLKDGGAKRENGAVLGDILAKIKALAK